MLVKGKKGAGRKPVSINNPFATKQYDEDLHEYYYDNSIQGLSRQEMDINVDDVLVGCIRSFKATLPNASSQEYVKHQHVLRIYKSLDTITVKGIIELLHCGKSVALKYIQVIKLCNPFLVRHLQAPKTNVTGYIDIDHKQVHSKPYIPYAITNVKDGL